MPKKIVWDKYEAALLIEKYIETVNGVITTQQAISELSLILRKRAVDLGADIDDVFRNENGISLRIEEIRYLFSDKKKGVSHTSKLFEEMVSIYNNDNDLFQRILTFSKAILIYPDGYRDEYQRFIS